jgi:hypothetical protein
MMRTAHRAAEEDGDPHLVGIGLDTSAWSTRTAAEKRCCASSGQHSALTELATAAELLPACLTPPPHTASTPLVRDQRRALLDALAHQRHVESRRRLPSGPALSGRSRRAFTS